MGEVSIKICGLVDEAGVEASISARADFIGLVFYSKSLRNISIESANRLSNVAKGRIQVVGLFVDPTIDFLRNVLSDVYLDVIQLHGNESPEMVETVKHEFGLPVWKAIGIRSREDLETVKEYRSADLIIYDTKASDGTSGGSGERFDWSILNGFAHPTPWMLAGGLNPDNIWEAIRLTGATLVDVSSGVETLPGVKHADLISIFCNLAHKVVD